MANNHRGSKNGGSPALRLQPRAATLDSPGDRIASVVPMSLKDPALFINRELSLLSFQKRVLEEAQDETNPLLERVRFISIVGSNLD